MSDLPSGRGPAAITGQELPGEEEAPTMRDNWRGRTDVLRPAVLSLVFSFSVAHAQHAPLPAWKTLAEESKAVVVADVAEGNLWVVDSEKEAKAERMPDGTFKGAANPALYVVGILAHVRIGEVLKGDGKIKQGDTIGVLVYGYDGLDSPTDPMDKERYVFFLRPVDANGKEFAHAVIQLVDRAAPPGHGVTYNRFDPKGCYTPVENGYAQVLVPPDKSYFIDKIKQAIAQGPRKETQTGN
jgi:hypothetical protein